MKKKRKWSHDEDEHDHGVNDDHDDVQAVSVVGRDAGYSANGSEHYAGVSF